MYAWANDAPPLVLPEGVGYQLSARVRYIVAELHYGHESSGLRIVSELVLSLPRHYRARFFWY